MNTQAMTVHLSQAIEDLKEMHLKLREKMNSQSTEDSSNQISKQIECLSGLVRYIESKVGHNTNRLRDIEVSVANLSDKVNDLNHLLCNVNRKESTKECTLVPVTAECENHNTVKNKPDTTQMSSNHPCSDDQSLQIKQNETFTERTITGAVSERRDEYEMPPRLQKIIHTSILGNREGSPTQSITSLNDDNVFIPVIHKDVDTQVPSQRKEKEMDVTDEPSISAHLYTNENDRRINNKITPLSTKGKTISDEKDSSFQNTSKTRNISLRKNEFGYKRKLSEFKKDNRVSFHNNQKCFEGTGCIQSEEVMPLSGDRLPEANMPHQSKTSSTNGKVQPKGHINSKRTENGYFSGIYDDETLPKEIVGFGQQKTVPEWLEYEQQVCAEASFRLRSGTVQRGHSRDVYLVLDTSERLKGYKFDTMKEAAKQYVKGIQQVALTIGHMDNIGIATFGGESQIVHVATSDYNTLIKLLDKLKPMGDAPIVGGLLMGMAGIVSGPLGSIGECTLQGHIIIFTDATSGQVTPLMTRDLGVQSIFLMGDFRGNADTDSVIEIVTRTDTKIYYVPISEDHHNPTLEKAVRSTNGKIIPRSELYRLVRLTQVILVAANIAPRLRGLENPAREVIQRKIAEMSSADDIHGDCVDWVLEFMNPLTHEMKKGMFVELNCRTLKLGDRVRRGPDWSFGDQDAHLPGTVIGQKTNGLLMVEWDHGHDNIYLYDEDRHHYKVMKVDEPRILVDEMVAVGCRVTRGQNWKYGNADGGPGSLGTVLQVRRNGKVVVRWDCRKMGLYKMGSGGKFEVRLQNDPRESEPFVTSDDSAMYPRFRDNNTEESNSRQSDITNSSNLEKNDFDYVIPVYSDTSVSAVWEFKENDTSWKKYPSEINTKIEKAYQRNKTGKIIIEMDRSTYMVHFSKMIQENVGNKTEIPVRRKD